MPAVGRAGRRGSDGRGSARSHPVIARPHFASRRRIRGGIGSRRSSPVNVRGDGRSRRRVCLRPVTAAELRAAAVGEVGGLAGGGPPLGGDSPPGGGRVGSRGDGAGRPGRRRPSARRPGVESVDEGGHVSLAAGPQAEAAAGPIGSRAVRRRATGRRRPPRAPRQPRTRARRDREPRRRQLER